MHDSKVVRICILFGDDVWQVNDVDVEEKGCQDSSLWDAVPEASHRSDDVKSQPSLFLHASQVVKFIF